MQRHLAGHPAARAATRVFFALSLFVVLAGAVGCQALGLGGSSGSLAGREFLSVTIVENGAPKALAGGSRIHLGFDASNLTASAGCNSMGGTYRVEAGRLTFENGATTAMGCPGDLAAQDAWLSTFLGSEPVVRLSGNDLTLDNGSTVITLLDRDQAEPDAALVGPVWTLESIVTGDAVSSVPPGIRATLLFKADGTVDVFAGCNRGSGPWAARGTGIEFGAIALTKMACQPPGGQVEGQVIGVLGRGQVGATIESQLLTLQVGDQGLVYRATDVPQPAN